MIMMRTASVSLCRRLALASRRTTPCTVRRAFSNYNNLLHIDQAVKAAISNGEPVVALESTIIAHGMPYPQNLELAKEVEQILRDKNVVPATIAVKDGVCCVGLSHEELEDLAKSGEEERAKKCSTRDLPFLMRRPSQKSSPLTKGQHQWGATTVASTMKLAYLAGISTFVTGGIGGVHRDGHVSMDVSADLTELSRTPVVVVSAGIKSILDIQRTLEVLETYGVPTVGWQTDEFPAFFSPKSGVPSPARLDSADDVASVYWASRDLDLPHGMLVAVPNDDPAGASVEQAIQTALNEANEQGIQGQAVTPFILKIVAEKTAGDSLKSNMALVRENARVGADIAIAIASSSSATQRVQMFKNGTSFSSNFLGGKVKVGGGRKRNLGIMRRSSDLRMSPLSPEKTVTDLVHRKADMFLIDGGADMIEHKSTLKKMAKTGADIVFIPSDQACAVAAYENQKFLSNISYAILDVEELLAISDGWSDNREDIEYALYDKNFGVIKEAATRTLKRMKSTRAHILVTMESRGLLLASKYGTDDVNFNQFENGVELNKGTAGNDSLCGAFLHQLLEGQRTESAAEEAYKAAGLLLSEGQSIYPLLSQYEARG